jgi:hypothetical protein
MDKKIAGSHGMNTNTNINWQGQVTDYHPQNGELFDRIAFILDQARANVVRSVNNQMVIAYCLIGREIVKEAQEGDERAEYGKKVLEELSARLSHRYGRGFSVTNLRYFRLFYQTYAERLPEIHHMACDESDRLEGIQQNHHKVCDDLEDMSLAVQKSECNQGFSPVLSWSHYRALTKVENRNERLFYELEAEKEGWNVPHLEQQINRFLFARLLKSRDKVGLNDNRHIRLLGRLEIEN